MTLEMSAQEFELSPEAVDARLARDEREAEKERAAEELAKRRELVS